MVVAAVLSFTGCYNDFDDPAPAKVWTEADFNKDQIITIKQLKDIYYAKYAPGSTAGLGKYVEITEDYVIRGKVISAANSEAFSQCAEPLRRPTTTLTPLSARFSEWAWPWLPKPMTATVLPSSTPRLQSES